MDEVYRSEADEVLATEVDREGGDKPAAPMHEVEIQSILRQALSGDKRRMYLPDADACVQPPMILDVRSLDEPRLGCEIVLNPVTAAGVTQPFSVSTFTIDKLKRKIIEDPYNAGQLQLFYPSGQGIKPFEIGRLHEETSEFIAWSFGDSLADADIQNGDIIYVRTLETAREGSSTSANSVADPRDVLLRSRLNLLGRRV
jgi:hypothetical protein